MKGAVIAGPATGGADLVELPKQLAEKNGHRVEGDCRGTRMLAHSLVNRQRSQSLERSPERIARGSGHQRTLIPDRAITNPPPSAMTATP
jgi:hypothetical protein